MGIALHFLAVQATYILYLQGNYSQKTGVIQSYIYMDTRIF